MIFISNRNKFLFGSAALVNFLGTGLFYPVTFLFYLHFSRLSLMSVGTTVSVATLIGLPMVWYSGRAVDLLGARRMLILVSFIRALAFCAYVFFWGYVAFFVITLVVLVCNRIQGVASPTLAAELCGADELPQWLALTRTMLNVGMLVGVGIGPPLLSLGGFGYVLISLINALSFIICGIIYLFVPDGSHVDAKTVSKPTGTVWSDGKYMRLSLTKSAFYFVGVTTELALPIYIVRTLLMKPWVISTVFILDLGLSTLVLIPITRRISGRDSLVPLLVGLTGILVFFVSLIFIPFGGNLKSDLLLIAVYLPYALGGLICAQMLSVMLVELTPRASRGQYLASNQVLTGFAAVLAPLFAGGLSFLGARGIWWLLAAVVLIMIAERILKFPFKVATTKDLIVQS